MNLTLEQPLGKIDPCLFFDCMQLCTLNFVPFYTYKSQWVKCTPIEIQSLLHYTLTSLDKYGPCYGQEKDFMDVNQALDGANVSLIYLSLYNIIIYHCTLKISAF